MFRCLAVAALLSAGGVRAQYNTAIIDATANSGAAISNNSSSRSTSGTTVATARAPGTTTGAGESTGVGAGPSLTTLAATAGLLVAGAGIVTTVYSLNEQARARLRAEEFRRLHPAQNRDPAGQPPPQPGVFSPPVTPAPPPLPLNTGRELPTVPSLDARLHSRAWFLANRLQLQQDLALGGGPSIEDLAGLAGISAGHRARFGRLLQRERARLLLPPALTSSEAAEAMSLVGELVLADPLLREDGARVMGAAAPEVAPAVLQ